MLLTNDMRADRPLYLCVRCVLCVYQYLRAICRAEQSDSSLFSVIVICSDSAFFRSRAAVSRSFLAFSLSMYLRWWRRGWGELRANTGWNKFLLEFVIIIQIIKLMWRKQAILLHLRYGEKMRWDKIIYNPVHMLIAVLFVPLYRYKWNKISQYSQVNHLKLSLHTGMQPKEVMNG